MRPHLPHECRHIVLDDQGANPCRMPEQLVAASTHQRSRGYVGIPREIYKAKVQEIPHAPAVNRKQ
jgi:hypothetical protein